MTACQHKVLKLILAFELVSAIGRGMFPVKDSNLIVPLFWMGGVLRKKMLALFEYAEEMREYPYTRSMENIRHVMNVRGAAVSREHCEAFELVRMII